VATEWLDDVFGPDNVRVSFSIESAAERWVRTWGDFNVSPAWATRVRNRLKRSSVATRPALHDGWVVIVEADTGQQLRLTSPSRESAVALAKSTAVEVKQLGVAALDQDS
jgi:hypothetical protein